MIMMFDINAIPVAKGRPRFRKLGSFVSTYTPKKTQDYEEFVKQEFIKSGCKKIEGKVPIWCSMVFFLPVPKSFSKQKREDCICGRIFPIVKPDLDNYVKAVLDALNGVAFEDDSQIVYLDIRKKYGEEPKTIIIFHRVEDAFSE